jgi:hypothetical protein
MKSAQTQTKDRRSWNKSTQIQHFGVKFITVELWFAEVSTNICVRREGSDQIEVKI